MNARAVTRDSRHAVTIAVLLAAFTGLANAQDPGPQRVDHDLAGWMVGKFLLVDQNGEPFTQAQLEGRWTFLIFGDTRCEQACTAALSALAGMFQRIARADAAKITQVLFVSLDPERDSPERLRHYLKPYGPRFIGATASRKSLSRLFADLSPGNPSGEPRKAGDLLLIGPDAFVRGEFLPPYDVLRLTERFMKVRIGR